MSITFLSTYSFFCSFILSFFLCIFPFGVKIWDKTLPYVETLLPYFILMFCSTFFNMWRIWYYQANPLCIFFVVNSEFHRCIKNKYFD